MTDVELSEKPAEVRADDVSGQETAAEAENNEAAKASESAEAIETAAREASEPEAEPSDENKSKKEKASASETLARAAKASKKVGGDIKKSAVSVFFGLTAFLSDFGAGLWGMLLRGSKKAAAFALRSSFAFMRKASRSSRLIFGRLVSVLRYVGASVWGVFAACFTAVFGTAWNIAAGIFGTVFGWAAKKLKQPLLEIFTFIVTPFAHAWGGVAHAHLRLKKASKRGFIHAVGSVFSSLGRFFGSVFEFLRYIFNYAAPVVSIVFLISLVRYASTLQYAISVEYNGSDIGTVENEAVVNEAQSLVQDKVTFTENTAPLISTPKFSVTVRSLDESESLPLSDIDELSELMIGTEDDPIVYAYGFYFNGDLLGVYSEEDMELVRDALNARLNFYNTPESVDCRFEDDIYLSQARFQQSALTDPADALELINGTTEVEAYYTVKKGDTISEICESLGISREEFDSDNPELSDGVRSGDIVTYHYSEPHLNVICSHYEVYDRVIERTTEYVESSRYEQYCEILLQHGSDGYENVTALVTETNGKETERTIVSRTVLEEMVPRKFRVGTKENTYLDGDTTIIDKLGTFCWPLADEDCYISSDFGYRSWDHSNHKAIDIAGIPRGTDIYAACDGKVTFSGWYAAYGKLVIVDCGHGYECYYGHCSELLVSVGDRVEKGDVIAEVGMTGSASGNHLHFEMRYDDERINPFMALGGPGGHRFNMA